MNRRYHAHLRLLKRVFDPGDESSAITMGICSRYRPQPLRILDVGVGEGKSSLRVVDALNKQGYDVSFTGLDLYIPPQTLRTVDEKTNWIVGDFCDFAALAGSFDVVIATQSLYYLGEARDALSALAAHGEVDGITVVTVWTSRCILYRIHKEIFPETRITFAEELVDLVGPSDLHPPTLLESKGEIGISDLLASESACRAAYEVLARMGPSATLDEGRYSDFRQFLGTLPAVETRENGTILFPNELLGH